MNEYNISWLITSSPSAYSLKCLQYMLIRLSLAVMKRSMTNVAHFELYQTPFNLSRLSMSEKVPWSNFILLLQSGYSKRKWARTYMHSPRRIKWDIPCSQQPSTTDNIKNKALTLSVRCHIERNDKMYNMHLVQQWLMSIFVHKCFF